MEDERKGLVERNEVRNEVGHKKSRRQSRKAPDALNFGGI